MKQPSVFEHTENLIKKFPHLFQDNSQTKLVIAQGIMNFFKEASAFILDSEQVNVFNNPQQKGLTKIFGGMKPTQQEKDEKYEADVHDEYYAHLKN